MPSEHRIRLTRRGFAATVGTAAGLAAQTQPQQRPGPPPEAEPFAAPIEFTRQDVAPQAQPFPMQRVRVTGGIYKQAAEWNRGYMNRLAADRLLYNFRRNAGLDVKGAQPLGGWEAPADGKHGTELRGHFTGHFLSASANLYASTGDADAKAKADSMVAELAQVQSRLGNGYLSAFPMELFDRLDAQTAPLPWAPFYTIHKIFAGMLDMHTLAENRQALDVAQGIGNWADEWSASKTEPHMQQILNTEYGGMAESLYNLAALTKDDRYARAGDRFTKKRFVNPLALRRDELRGLHVNTHIPQVIAAARRYEISGDVRFHDVADYFYQEVTQARTYVTGGTSNGESWRTEPRRLAAELKLSVATAECCCSYNMMKLTRHLYSWNPDPRYFDYYERALLNHRIGTIHPETGYTQYYLSLTPGTWKTFNTEDQSFWCCTGTGVEEFSRLNDSIYWHDERGLYVNLFIPSELDWTEKSLRIRQETKFPSEPTTALTVTAAKPVETAIRLRIPAWTRDARVKLNGRTLEASAEPGSYLTLDRVWKTGDRIDLELPMRRTVEAMPDDPRMQAFLYGPLVLAGDLGTEGLTEKVIVGPNAPPVNRQPRVEIPVLKAGVKPEDQGIELVPLNTLFDRRYTVYWQVA